MTLKKISFNKFTTPLRQDRELYLLKLSLKALQSVEYILKSFDARRSRSDCIRSETLC